MQKAIPQSKEGKPRTLVSQISMQDGINVQDGHFLKFAVRLFGCLSKKDSNKGVQDGPFPKRIRFAARLFRRPEYQEKII